MAGYMVRSKLFGAKDESQAMRLMLLAQAEDMGMVTPTDNNNLRTHWLAAVSKAQTLDALESVWKLGLVELKQDADSDLQPPSKPDYLSARRHSKV